MKLVTVLPFGEKDTEREGERERETNLLLPHQQHQHPPPRHHLRQLPNFHHISRSLPALIAAAAAAAAAPGLLQRDADVSDGFHVHAAGLDAFDVVPQPGDDRLDIGFEGGEIAGVRIIQGRCLVGVDGYRVLGGFLAALSGEAGRGGDEGVPLLLLLLGPDGGDGEKRKDGWVKGGAALRAEGNGFEARGVFADERSCQRWKKSVGHVRCTMGGF